MVQFSLPASHKNRSTSLFNRRHVMLLALIALTAPLFAQVVLGAVVSHSHPRMNVTTEHAMELLTRPRNFHGVVNFSHGDHSRQEIKTASSATAKNRLNDAIYPIKDRVPDVNHPQVKAWVREIDWSKVPKIPVAEGLPDAPHFPKCPPDEDVDKRSCWWSCDGCVSEDDVMTCPDSNSWGLTYDDGPSDASRDMMQHLNGKGLTATFFIVGSRVLDYPDILKDQVAQGHHIAMHTWSHAGLTTLTNEEIVAEIRWSEKIIRDVTGLTMKYIRPPYGDVDNRVREILRQMGYTTVIWTLGWDTNDWRVAMHQIQVPEIVKTFKNALGNRANIRSPDGSPGGPVTLEHDLTEGTIELSKQIIPLGMAQGLRPMSLAKCLNDANPYQIPGKTGEEQHLKPGEDGKKDGKKDGGKDSKKDPAVAVHAPGNGTTDGSKGASSKSPNPQAPESKDEPKGAGDNSKVRSEAVAAFKNGLKTLGYAAMGLTAVTSYMLTL